MRPSRLDRPCLRGLAAVDAAPLTGESPALTYKDGTHARTNRHLAIGSAVLSILVQAKYLSVHVNIKQKALGLITYSKGTEKSDPRLS